jgi:hypothetical protein
MNPLWLVVWTVFKCPFWFPSAAPVEVKPIFCRPVEHAEDFVNWSLAVERMEEAGPDGKPKLFRINGEKYEPVTAKWKHKLEIKED